jgi:Bax protein
MACSRQRERHEVIDPLPVSAEDITTISSIPDSHKVFMADFLPEIHRANNNILRHRNSILDLRDTLEKNDSLKASQLNTVHRFMQAYRLKQPAQIQHLSEEKLEETINKLLARVDIIPVKLVMAQAIIESGWGNSGFAREQNNYFGVRCYTEGCGVSPAAIDSAAFFVKSYPSLRAGIDDYLWILNTGHAYKELRRIRLDFREKRKAPDPVALARGLTKYSARGEDYVNTLVKIIRNYIPENTHELLTGNRP